MSTKKLHEALVTLRTAECAAGDAYDALAQDAMRELEAIEEAARVITGVVSLEELDRVSRLMARIAEETE